MPSIVEDINNSENGSFSTEGHRYHLCIVCSTNWVITLMTQKLNDRGMVCYKCIGSVDAAVCSVPVINNAENNDNHFKVKEEQKHYDSHPTGSEHIISSLIERDEVDHQLKRIKAGPDDIDCYKVCASARDNSPHEQETPVCIASEMTTKTFQKDNVCAWVTSQIVSFAPNESANKTRICTENDSMNLTRAFVESEELQNLSQNYLNRNQSELEIKISQQIKTEIDCTADDSIENYEPVDDIFISEGHTVDIRCADESDLKVDLILCPVDSLKSTSTSCCHQCRVCPKIFRNIDVLAKHERTHNDRLPFVDRLRARKKAVVTESDDYDMEWKESSVCSHCYKIFDNNSRLKRHIEQVHNKVHDLIQTAHLNNAEVRRNVGIAPMAITSKETSCQLHCCTVCNNLYSSETDLKTHIQFEHPRNLLFVKSLKYDKSITPLHVYPVKPLGYEKSITPLHVYPSSSIHQFDQKQANYVQHHSPHTLVFTNFPVNSAVAQPSTNVASSSLIPQSDATNPNMFQPDDTFTYEITTNDSSKLSSSGISSSDLQSNCLVSGKSKDTNEEPIVFGGSYSSSIINCTTDQQTATSFESQKEEYQNRNTALPQENDRKMKGSTQSIGLRTGGPQKAASYTIPTTNNLSPQCSLCNMRFVKLVDLQIHEKKHLPQYYLCGLCDERSTDILSLKHHYYSQHRSQSDGMLTCTICNYRHRYYKRFATHMRKHTDERPFSCTECSQKFKDVGTLKEHCTGKHAGFENYSCPQCGMKFNRNEKELFQLHRESHANPRPFVCIQCDKRFMCRAVLRVHIKYVHKKERNSVCVQCGKAFKNKSILDNHIRQVHTGERPFICPQCGNRFSSSKILRSHERNSHGDKVLACKLCENKYNTIQRLKHHVRVVHNGERRFSCNQCQKKFSNNTQLTTHMVTHTRERAFGCNQCDKKFSTWSSRCRHIKESHVGEERYKCPHCDMMLTQKTSLIRHVGLLHSDERPYVCAECKKRFTDAPLLKQHLQTHESFRHHY